LDLQNSAKIEPKVSREPSSRLHHLPNETEKAAKSMHPYITTLVVGAIISALLAGALFVHHKAAWRESSVSGLILGCGIFWSLCQIQWNTTDDPELAIYYVRLSSLGWMMVAPLALQLGLSALDIRESKVWRLLPWTYAVTAGFVVLDWTTPWCHPRAIATSWGFTYEVGIGFYCQVIWLTCLTVPAVWMGLGGFRNSSPAERNQSAVIGVALLVPLTIGLLTDALLPLIGIPFPHLGSISICFLGVASAYSRHRFGYSVLVPTVFAEEILEALPGGVAMIRMDGRIRSANCGLGELLGCTPAELYDRKVHEILSPSLETLIAETRSLDCELTIRGEQRIPVALTASVLRDKVGFPIGVVLVIYDQREVTSLRNRLLLSGRLAAVGELAAGVAHEINNPLAYVRSNLSMLSHHWAEVRSAQDPADSEATSADLAGARSRFAEILDEGDDLLTESLEGVDRASSIVQDIKGFAHAGTENRETVDLNPLLESVLRIAAPQLNASVQLDTNFSPLPLIQCAPQQIKQVFLNLILNSSQAIRDEGFILVESQRADDWVVIRVLDNGEGISSDVIDRVFDPFFTTKPVGEGTGLGLSISYEILRRHGGEIIVASSSSGSCFEVRLPVA
jgi:signal transduction histidine kinase